MVSLAQICASRPLAERPPASAGKFPAFQAGGVVAISGDAGCAIGVPAPADEAMALTVASAVGGSRRKG